jgi:hypothetical protein
MADRLIVHRILEAVVAEMGLVNVIALLSSVASNQADKVETEQGDVGDIARTWRQDSQVLRSVIHRLRH